jgi:hypothetical protein|tara:strand:+ start:46 stop:312 length:267 start_codon:yes stop_codon:yes gene_type:complete
MSNSEQNNNSDWKEREIGAFWKRESSNQKYLSGKIKVGGEEVGVVVFTNRYKEEGSKQPDFRVYLERQREDQPATATATQASEEDDLL